jgi:hypothetical protein
MLRYLILLPLTQVVEFDRRSWELSILSGPLVKQKMKSIPVTLNQMKMVMVLRMKRLKMIMLKMRILGRHRPQQRGRSQMMMMIMMMMMTVMMVDPQRDSRVDGPILCSVLVWEIILWQKVVGLEHVVSCSFESSLSW